MEIHRDKMLSKGHKIFYAVGQVAETMVYVLFYFYFVFFLTDVVGFDPAFAGLVSMIGVLWDAFSDPLIGSISDNARFKLGRRRPFLVWFAIPFGISTGFLCTMFDLGPTALKIYFIIAVIVFFTCYTLFYIPYLALGAEMTLDYDERTSLQSYKGIGMTIGMFLGAVSPLLLSEFYLGLNLTKSTAWSLTGFTIGGLAAVAILVCWSGTKGTEMDISEVDISEVDKQRMTFVQRYTTVFTNRPFRFIYAMLIVGVIGQTFSGAIMMYYATYYMGMDVKTISIVMAISPLSGLIFAPIVNIAAQTYGKKSVYIVFLVFWALVQSSIFFVQPGNVTLLIVLNLLNGAGIVAFWVLLSAMASDVTDVDEWDSGERREGLYFGVFSLVQKVGAAVTMALMGSYLSMIGYVANAEQTTTTISGLRLGYSAIAAIPLLLSAIICIFYPLTSQKHKALREALANRTTGKPFSTKEFDKMIQASSKNLVLEKT